MAVHNSYRQNPYAPDWASKKYQVWALLNHYMSTAFEAAGLGWTSDNKAEIQQLTELLVGEENKGVAP